ncbi:MAG: hypothetical protein H0U73_10170 [Tatlockia sp.]|nr:hypothetical protein [Tatlockia sp.]
MKKTISVFFSGSNLSIDDRTLVAGYLYHQAESSETQIKNGFNGCAKEFGFWGGILGSGLDKQCDEIIQRVKQELARGHELTLNAYGLSRGGVAALMLAQQLSLVDPDKLSINLALLDPVPGNLITSASLDPFNVTLANKVKDLSACKPLKKVLALYPYTPLADLAFHAPLFPTYPKHIELTEELIPGTHAGAERLWGDGKLTRLLVMDFFKENGTQFKANKADKTHCEGNLSLNKNKQYCNIYEQKLRQLNREGPMTRDTHSSRGVYITAKTGAQYFNQHHKRLAKGNEDATVAVAIEENPGFFSRFKKRIAANSSFEIEAALTTFLIPALVVLWLLGGPLSFGLTLVTLITTAVLWKVVIKPLISWALERFFYPMYSMCNLDCADLEEKQDSPDLIIEGLGGSKRSANQNLEIPYQGKNPLGRNESNTKQMHDNNLKDQTNLNTNS